MTEKCTSCGSCGMPLETPADHALGDVTSEYCRFCTDEQGRLLPYERVLAITAEHLVTSQGITAEAAQHLAEGLLADMPAWRKRTLRGA